MPYPNSTASVIVISQTSGSAVGGQFPFIERQISGSNLFLVTDASGNLTGSTSIPGGSFTNLTVTGALTASIISASNAITAAAITSGPITASNISASGFVSASNIFDAGTLVVIGSSILAALTASNISASTISSSGLFTTTGVVSGQLTVGSGFTTNGSTVLGNNQGNTVVINPAVSTTISSSIIQLTGSVINFSGAITASSVISASAGITASSINVVNSIVDGGSLTVLGNTTLGDNVADTTTITGSLNQSGSYFTNGSITASGTISASLFVGAHTGSTFGTASWAQSASNAVVAQTASFLPVGTYNVTSSWATNALTASSLVAANTYIVTGLSASGTLSASNISASSMFIGGTLTYRESMLTGSAADIYFSASAITASDVVVQIDSSVATGSAYALVLNATSSTGGIAYALSASSGIIVGSVFSGSVFSGSYTGSITGQTLTMTGNSVLTTLTASNISASGNISASLFVGPVTGSVFGTSSWASSASVAVVAQTASFLPVGTYNVTSSWATNALTASSLVLGNSYAITNLTASNISSSGTVSGSNGWFNNLTVPGTLTATVSGSITTANSSSITANNSTATLQYITFVDGTGNRPLYVDQDSLTWQPSTNTLSSSGNFIGSNYTGSRMTATGGAGSSTAVGTQGILASNGIGANGNSYFSSDVGIGTTLTVGAAISSSNALWVGGNTTLAGNSAAITHTGTGNLTISSNNGSVLVEGSTFTGNDVTIPGDIAVNGGDITTTAATFNLATANATTINIGGASATTIYSGLLDVTNTTAATIAGAGAIQTDGGVYIGKNLIVSGSTTLYGDVTMIGTGSIINISSSNIIIGDNRIQLNAWSVGGPQRYGGVDIFDSGSSAAVTSSILWDSLNNYWLLQTNQSGSSPLVTSSAIILQGPTSSFGSEFLLTVNNFLKVQTTTGNMITSSLSEVGNTLQYAGTISASVISGSNIFGATGSFINLSVLTGSAPNTGSQVPTSPTAAGLPGEIAIDNNFIYVYTNNLWKRTALNIWSA